jgi:hypothetical protein
MPNLRLTLIAALAILPSAALAQTVIVEPPMLPEEAILVPMEPMPEAPLMGPLDEEGAATIAMMNGIAAIDEVDHRMWDGNFEVEGTDAAGEDIEMVIDAETGEVLDIDD